MKEFVIFLLGDVEEVLYYPKKLQNYNLKITRQIDLVFALFSLWMMQFDEFLKWNYNLKITRQIDFVLRYLAYE